MRGVLVDAGCRVGAPAVAEGDAAALEVAEELVPLGVGGGAVLFARPGGPALGDEGPVSADGLLGVGRLVAHRGVYVLVSEYELGDVRGHAVEDGVGGEDPSEVVGPEGEGLAVGAGDAGGGERAGQEVADSVGGDGAVLQADDPLEQQGHRRFPGPLVRVVGRGERDGPATAADAGDDGGQGVGELGADDEEALGVFLGRGDRQQGDQLAGRGEPALDQAVVGELCQLLDADAGAAQIHTLEGPIVRIFWSP